MSRTNEGDNNGGCAFPISNNQICECGETQTLEIIKEFNKLYVEKLRKIQSAGDHGSNLQAKINLQQDWIRDLTEQNEMLVRVVEELEVEATDRVVMLEEKLRNSAQQGNEVMQKYRDFNFAINLDATFQNLVYLQSDVRNLLEFIKRARDEGIWSIAGLQFYNIGCEDLFGSAPCDQGTGDQKSQKQLKISQKLEEKEKLLQQSKEILDHLPNKTQALAVRLKEKDQELNTLRRSMLDMRNALTIEVAEKHDVILNLRRDVQQLEEKYRQANKQTQFKDDIIKEMRKEIKLLKGQTTELCVYNTKCKTMDSFTDMNCDTSCPSDTPPTFCQIMNNLSQREAEIKQNIQNECQLFFRLGKEINLLLLDTYEKDKKLFYQKELITLLVETVNFMYFKLKTMQTATSKHLNNVDCGCKKGATIIKNFTQTLESIQEEVDKSLTKIKEELHNNHLHISVEASADSEDLRIRVKKLEDENRILKNQIAEARGEVNSLNVQATTLTGQLAGTKKEFERERRESNALIEALKNENALYRRQSTEVGIQSEDVHSEVSNVPRASTELNEISNVPRTPTELKEALEKEQQARDVERSKHNQEISNLKDTILELEKALQNTQTRSENLQKTVDLYQNSVNILEASEQQSAIEIFQLRQTVLNLQDALVTSKHQLDELQQKASSELDSLNDLVEHLRDTNLDLAVANFSYIQDVAILETRLLKYQHICRSNEDCICGLQGELIKLRDECKQQIKTNCYLKQQLVEVTCACKSMQNMESEAKELQKMLQKVNGDLHQQADLTKQELLREAQLNNKKAEQIEELQNMVGAKTRELNQCAGECCKVKQQLTITMQLNQELQAELAQLKSQIQNYRQTAATSEELSEYCQKEIEKCKCNITELSNRYKQTKDQLQQKTEVCSKLEAELCAQNNNCMCLQQQLQDSKTRYEIDQSDLRHTINDLTDKLAKTENNFQILHEDFRRSQDEILEITQRKAKLQLDNEQHKRELTETMQKLKQEELGLGECVCKLETESAVLKRELKEKDRQMEILQEENVELKNEVNKILQRYNKLKAEHEQLHIKYEELNTGLSMSEYKTHITKEQFNQCLCGLQAVHMEKDRLETKNKQLQTDLEKLQRAYGEMEHKYKNLNESVVTLEMKLLDNNMCREEICAESRNVISNVRAWLQNQTTINEELTQKLRDDEILIENLKQQIAMTRSHSHGHKCRKCVCKIRERGGGLSGDRFLRYTGTTRSQPDLWSPGSQGSGTISPVSIVSNTQEWYAYEEFGEEGFTEDDSLLSQCLKRVESINEELQKSNQFWKNKMTDHDYLVTRDQ